MVITTLVQTDAELAVAQLNMLPRGRQRNRAARDVVSTWSRVDAKAAMSWAIANRGEFDGQMLNEVSGMFIHQYPKDAMQYLPLLDRATAQTWAVQIAGVLADSESMSAATAFVEQYKGTADYPLMQSALIPRIAQRDLRLAKGMADQMPPGIERDQVMTSLIGQKAATDPAGALTWVESVAGDEQRQSALSIIVMTWARSEPEAATRYVRSLGAGASRDNAIFALVQISGEADAPSLQLVESIGDVQRRIEARTSLIYRLARDDPGGARSMMDKMALSEGERQVLESVLEQFSNGMVFD
jgi:hypothetical protein